MYIFVCVCVCVCVCVSVYTYVYIYYMPPCPLRDGQYAQRATRWEAPCALYLQPKSKCATPR